MSSSQIGLAALFAFALFQGVRDALFGNVFQSVSFLLVAILAFGASSILFLGIAAVRYPRDFPLLAAFPGKVLWINVSTAAAWLGFLYALRHLEPAVVATLYNGAGPVTIILIALFGGTNKQDRLSLGEVTAYAGLAAALAGLMVVVMLDASGLSGGDPWVQASALAGAFIGGVFITASYLTTRQINDAGVSTEGALGASFLLTLLIAAALEFSIGDPAMRPEIGNGVWLTVVAFILIVFPALLVRIGVKRSSPLAANVFRTLGPVCVFAVQQVDGRLHFSGATLACVIAFCVCSIIASGLRFWGERNEAA